MTDDNLRARLAHLEDRLERIEQAETATDADGREWSVTKLVEMGLTRRQAMLAVGTLAVYGGSIWAAIKYATGSAEAATDQVGTQSVPVDVIGDTVEANVVETGALNNGGSAIAVTDNLDLQSSQSVQNAALVDTDEVTNSNYVEPQATDSASTSYTADLSTGNYHKLTLTGDVSIDISNVDSSDTNSLLLQLVQDGTGGRTPSFTPTVVWPGGSAPSWSTSANAEDVVTLVHDQDASQWLGFVGGLGFA